MNTTFGFPPVDSLIAQMINVDYHKLIRQFLMFIVTIAAVIVAVSQFVYKKAAQWYHNGGKELMISYANRAVLYVNNKTKLFDKLYVLLVRFYNLIELAAHKVEDVTVVKVAQ